MAFYREQVLPRLVDRACGGKDMERWRSKVTAGLSGTVIEIGFGSGLNMPVYPPEVHLDQSIQRPREVRRAVREEPRPGAGQVGAVATVRSFPGESLHVAVGVGRRSREPGAPLTCQPTQVSPPVARARKARTERKPESRTTAEDFGAT